MTCRFLHAVRYTYAKPSTGLYIYVLGFILILLWVFPQLRDKISDRDAFRSLLVCVPRIVKQREVEVVKRKRNGGEIDLRPNKTSKESGDGLRAAKKVCFNFKNEGTCKFGATCKFAHIKEE